MIRLTAAIAGLGLVSLSGSEPLTAVRSGSFASQTLPAVMAKTTAAYAALKTYSDSGTVEVASPGMTDRAKFTTHFRQPDGDLYFDYQPDGTYNGALRVDMTGYRNVIWMLKGHMEAYEKSSQTHTIIEGGRQASVLTGLSAATRGTSLLIPSLLYPKARLAGTFSQIEEATDTGFEEVASRRCHKVTGIAALYYPSGARTGVRAVTVWIDAETFLIRRVFEDTPKGYPGNTYHRMTVTIDPRVNAPLEDGKFQFKVPAQ